MSGLHPHHLDFSLLAFFPVAHTLITPSWIRLDHLKVSFVPASRDNDPISALDLPNPKCKRCERERALFRGMDMQPSLEDLIVNLAFHEYPRNNLCGGGEQA